MIIDGTDLILGRLATYVAKQALLGEKIDVVNAEKVIVTGNKVTTFNKYKDRVKMGDNVKGPFIPRLPDRLLRRAIRGMLPYKQEKGRLAFKRVMCYVGLPEKFKDQKLETIKNAHITKMKNLKYTTIEKISKQIK